MDMESGPQSGFNSPWVDSNRSESTPAMSALFAEMFLKYVDPGVARVVNGGVEVMYVVLLVRMISCVLMSFKISASRHAMGTP